MAEHGRGSRSTPKVCSTYNEYCGGLSDFFFMFVHFLGPIYISFSIASDEFNLTHYMMHDSIFVNYFFLMLRLWTCLIILTMCPHIRLFCVHMWSILFCLRMWSILFHLYLLNMYGFVLQALPFQWLHWIVVTTSLSTIILSIHVANVQQCDA